MAGLDDIINLTITIESSSITRAGFGTPLVADYNTRYSGALVRSYSKPSAMVADGFVVSDPAYVAANAMMSQNPRPRTVKIGRRTHGPAQRFNFTPLTGTARTYAFGIAITGGAKQSVSYAAASADSANTIVNALTAQVAALSGYGGAGLTASNQTGVLRIQGPATGPKFVVTDADISQWTSILDDTQDASLATDLDAIELEDSDWYGFISTSKGTNELNAAAGWVASRRKFFIGGTQNSDIASAVTNDIASTLKAASQVRTALFVNDGAHNQGDAAALGKWLPYTPGSETMKFKTIVGVLPTKWTDTQLGYIKAKNANYYITVAGTSMFGEGKTCQGEFMDTIRFVDWLYANIQEEIFGILNREIKVPFTDDGVAQIESGIRAVLKRGVNAGGLAKNPAFSVTVPLVADVSTLDKSARRLPDITFNATLAGAIHELDISGTVSV